MLYTTTRLMPATAGFALWAALANGSLFDPANVLLLFAGPAAVVGFASVRRYWFIRNTSRSRRNSTLLA